MASQEKITVYNLAGIWAYRPRDDAEAMNAANTGRQT